MILVSLQEELAKIISKEFRIDFPTRWWLITKPKFSHLSLLVHYVKKHSPECVQSLDASREQSLNYMKHI